STALRPPNARVTLSAMMIGSTLATPGATSPTCSPVDLTGATDGFESAGIERQLLLASEDPLRAVDNDEHEGEAHEHVPQHARLSRAERQNAHGRQGRQEHAQERHEAPED